jgi:alkylation response protein AidB-like acyl-CoA dehydrogenase
MPSLWSGHGLLTGATVDPRRGAGFADRLGADGGELDRLKQFPDKPARLAELGILGMTMPPEYGGAGADTVRLPGLMEISRARQYRRLGVRCTTR